MISLPRLLADTDATYFSCQPPITFRMA